MGVGPRLDFFQETKLMGTLTQEEESSDTIEAPSDTMLLGSAPCICMEGAGLGINVRAHGFYLRSEHFIPLSRSRRGAEIHAGTWGDLKVPREAHV